MKQADRTRLIRLLGMTGSSSDGEALNAMRMAGKLIAELGLTWAQVLEPSPAAPAIGLGHAEDARRAGYEAEVEKLNVKIARERLDAILRRMDADQKPHLARSHFESVRAYHQHTGYINPAHRAQIDRQFFKSGWDSPLGGDKVAEARAKAIDDGPESLG